MNDSQRCKDVLARHLGPQLVLQCDSWLFFVCFQVQILSKKVDLSKVTSKCGSKTNIKHKPGRERKEGQVLYLTV